MKIKPVLIQIFGGFADVKLEVPNLKKNEIFAVFVRIKFLYFHICL